jgi:hypothetical protein
MTAKAAHAQPKMVHFGHFGVWASDVHKFNRAADERARTRLSRQAASLDHQAAVAGRSGRGRIAGVRARQRATTLRSQAATDRRQSTAYGEVISESDYLTRLDHTASTLKAAAAGKLHAVKPARTAIHGTARQQLQDVNEARDLYRAEIAAFNPVTNGTANDFGVISDPEWTGLRADRQASPTAVNARFDIAKGALGYVRKSDETAYQDEAGRLEYLKRLYMGASAWQSGSADPEMFMDGG